jgi:hypothetical protein
VATLRHSVNGRLLLSCCLVGFGCAPKLVSTHTQMSERGNKLVTSERPRLDEILCMGMSVEDAYTSLHAGLITTMASSSNLSEALFICHSPLFPRYAILLNFEVKPRRDPQACHFSLTSWELDSSNKW